MLEAGDLVLMDYAPDFRYYMSDVTRVWPVDGTFSGDQRDLYTFYPEAYRSILDHIGPGLTAAEIIARAAEDMDAVLERSTFSKPEYRRAAENFVAGYRSRADRSYASLGHWEIDEIERLMQEDGILQRYPAAEIARWAE